MNRSKFNKLQAKWYKTLKESGFKDIECSKVSHNYINSQIQNSPFLKQHSGITRQRYSRETEDHFRRCRIHLAHHKFKNKRLKQLFEWYTDGQSYRKIVKLHNKKFKPTRSIYSIHTLIKKLKDEMVKCGHWKTEEEMDEREIDLMIGVVNCVVPES